MHLFLSAETETETVHCGTLSTVLVGCLVGWLIGGLVGWLFGWLVGGLVGWLVRVSHCGFRSESTLIPKICERFV